MEVFCSPRERIGKSTTIGCNRANCPLDDADVYIVVGNRCIGVTLCYVDRKFVCIWDVQKKRNIENTRNIEKYMKHSKYSARCIIFAV